MLRIRFSHAQPSTERTPQEDLLWAVFRRACVDLHSEDYETRRRACNWLNARETRELALWLGVTLPDRKVTIAPKPKKFLNKLEGELA